MMTTMITDFNESVFGTLNGQGRLLNAVFKDALPKEGKFGFRGDIALAFQEQVADEARPPAYSLEQGLFLADGASGKIEAMAGYLHNFAWLKDVGEILGDYLDPDGVYLFFANNIDFLKKYRVPLTGSITVYVLPLDESTVWKEVLELLDIERTDIKKLDAAGKLQAVMDKLVAFSAAWPEMSYEEGVETMEPVRNRNENRPV